MDRREIRKRVWRKIRHQVDLSAGALRKPYQQDVKITTDYVLDAIMEIMAEDIQRDGYSKIVGIGKIRADIQLKTHYIPGTRNIREFHSVRTRFRFFRKFGTALKAELVKKYLENAEAEGNKLVSQGDAG